MSMMDKADQKRLMIQYLYGELPADESNQFEGTYLKYTEVFHELVALENEIVDQYVLGELTETERERFEHSLSRFPARREAVETARTLLAYSAAAENELSTGARAPEKYQTIDRYRNWRMRVAATAVFVVAISGIFWLLFQNHRLGKELDVLRHEQAAAIQEKQALQRQIDSLHMDLHQLDNALQRIAQLPRFEHDVVSFTLDSGLFRETGELPRLLVPSRAAYVKFHIFIAHETSPIYSISIRTPDDRLVWRTHYVPSIHAQGYKEVTFTLPAHLLQNGDYVVRVSSGKEDSLHNVAGYSFRVIRP